MIAAWLDERRQSETGVARPIPLATSGEWALRDGALSHRGGGFFAVVGARVRAPLSRLDGAALPFIDQPEVGLLGLVTAPGPDGALWLLQAKSEPGAVGWVQAGPAVQATRSNYLRRHGGSPTRFLDLFEARGGIVGTDHSEQGSRFVAKWNRNAIVAAPEPFDPGHPNWRWFDAAALRAALAEDFVVNTDARSVVASGDWGLLRGDGPLFSGPSWAEGPPAALRDALREAASERCGQAEVAALRARLGGRAPAGIERVPLDALPGWAWEGARFLPPDGRGGVEMVAVEAPGREVARWDQPLLLPRAQDRAVLALAPRGGRLHVALRVAAEPGFRGRREFGPTWQSDGDAPEGLAEAFADGPAPVLSVAQSDEGGRFLRCLTRYDVVVLDEPGAQGLGDGVAWASLPALRRLCATGGTTTNELRSAVSVLLSLA